MSGRPRRNHPPAFKIHREVDSDRTLGLLPPTLETTMQTVVDRPEAPIAIYNNLGAIFISLELSRSRWLITSLALAGGEKMSICATSGENAGEDGEGLPVHLHSGGRPRGVLDRPRAAE
jgi:hypothetical protein